MSHLLVSCSKIIALHNLEAPTPNALSTFSPHRGIVNCVIFNHTNKLLASCGIDGRVLIVSVEKPQNLVLQHNFQQRKVVPVTSCAFSSSTRYLAAGGGTMVKIWELKSSKDPPMQIRSHFSPVTTLTWSKFDDVLASGSNMGDIFLHSAKSGNIIQSFQSRNQQGISMVRFSQGESHNRLAACTTGGSLLIWDLMNPKASICAFPNIHKASATALAFSSFNPVLVVTTSLDQNINFYDVHEKKSFKTITADQALNSVALHSDGHTLVAGGMYGGLFVYDLRKPEKPKQRLLGHQSAVKFLDFVKEKEGSSGNTGVSRNSQQVITQPQNVEPPAKQPVTRSSSRVPQQSGSLQPSHPPLSTIAPKPPVLNPQLQQRNSGQQQPLPEHREGGSNRVLPRTNNFVQQVPPPSKLHELLGDMEKRIRNQMAEKFQLMHLEMVRQFQLQQRDLQSLMENLVLQDRAKDQAIRRLEAQNQKLRKNTY